MMAKPCRQLPMIEAYHEGRLRDACPSFERHLSRCAACQGELAELHRLRDTLRALPKPTIDEVATRRRRQRLLADACRHAPARAFPRRGIIFALAAALLGLVLFGAHSWRAGARPACPTTPAMAAESPSESDIVARTGTRWSRLRTATSERVDLVEGELTLDVHRKGSQQLVVVLPDGEIMDIGTRFLVSVSGGATTRIVVSEGVVVFRRHDGYEMRLEAPATWTSSESASTAPSAAPATASAPPPAPVRKGAPVIPAVEAAATLFADANGARRTGDHERAMGLYRRLEHAFPTSREAHAAQGIVGRLLLDRGDPAGALASFDAYRGGGPGPLDMSVLFGRAVALERLGRSNEARAAWSALLEAFPTTPYAEHALSHGGVSPSR